VNDTDDYAHSILSNSIVIVLCYPIVLAFKPERMRRRMKRYVEMYGGLGRTEGSYLFDRFGHVVSDTLKANHLVAFCKRKAL
jgi:hypothetical protein